ncbi:MAG: hypothetical protein V1915_01365 [Candidatus Bathyarchaeota archaeon]
MKKCFQTAITLIEDIDKGNVRHTLLTYRINFIHKSSGKKFAELYPKREYFRVTWKEAGGWDNENASTLEEFRKLLDEKLKNAVELVKEK